MAPSKRPWILSSVIQTFGLYALVVTIPVLPGAGRLPLRLPLDRGAKGPAPGPGSAFVASSAVVPKPMHPLVGTWEKFTPQISCSDVYPDTINFQENGLYFGRKDPPGTFTQWDVGTWEVVDSKKVKLSTANDAVITYEFAISHDVLTFVDPEACRFQYRRAL
jgi:hypothetical protein